MLRAVASRLVMPSRRGCDSATIAGSGTAFQPVIGGPRESPSASRRVVELEPRRNRQIHALADQSPRYPTGGPSCGPRAGSNAST